MAMAPEQIGIGIRRFFTKPGVHPYDTVQWERRDARIQNFKDGTDAFFQPDVEFPVGWSQNATNIVAQKYFRGTLGTAERETSLKQVIDRVADTITAWGVRDGYFVDDREGAAFRNELKFILLHQRAAATRGALASYVPGANRELAGTDVVLSFFGPVPSNTESESPYFDMWRKMGVALCEPDVVAREILATIRQRRRAHIMGGGLLRMLTLANAVSPSTADVIGLRRFAKLIEQHRPR